jgi:PKD repeat protein
MKIILSGLLSVIVLSSFAQQPRPDKLIPVTKSISTPYLKSLEAKFTSDITQGVAPLTVQFTDQSTGNPSSWKWLFGDGDSSLVQNPVHIYQSTGIFTVKFTISDGVNGFTLEKKDFIGVTQNFSNCDTLHYPLPEPLTFYIIKDKGYVTGNNNYHDKAISDYFENTQSNLLITGMIFEFSIAKQNSGQNERIPVNIWSKNVSSGKPGVALASDTLMLSALVNDVVNNRTTTIDLENPVQPGGSFYLGVMLPGITGDTLCLWSTSSGKLPVNTTWILQSNNEWESAQDLWTSQGNPPFIISSAIYPKICLLNGVGETALPLSFAIWPNPAQNMISIVNQQGINDNKRYSIYDTFGKELLNGSISESLCTITDVSKLKSGIYIVRITGDKSSFSTKLIKK